MATCIRSTDTHDTYMVPTREITSFLARVRRLGAIVIRSAPVGGGYQVTVTARA